MKVVHVVVAGEIGGAERMLLDLATRSELTGATHAVALMTPSDALRALIHAAGVRVHDRGPVREDPAAYLWHTLGPQDVHWIAKVLAEERADVAHLHTFASQVIGTRAARRVGARVVRTEHSTRVYDDATCWPFSRWSLRRADAVVAVSAHVRRVAMARAPWIEPRVSVVRNGVDVDRFAPHAAPPSSGVLRLVLVGRLERRKGVDLAVEAIAHVDDVALDVVGDGEERAALEKLARARGVADRVRFHGRLDDPRPVVAAADAALCSSREEGLGIALVEAMAMGKPVIGFAVGGVPEIVHDGETGFLARPDGLAARIRDARAMKARLPEIGRTARAFAERACSAPAMCEGYRDVYARALSRPSR